MAQETIVIDTNVFLEFLLLQERREECIALMRKIERDLLDAYVTSFTLHSIEVLLDKHGKTQLLRQFLKRVMKAEGLTVYQTSPKEELRIAALAKKTNLDFDDALQYYVTKALDAALVSLDRDFDATDIKRLEPDEL